jgi:hypothetical protein
VLPGAPLPGTRAAIDCVAGPTGLICPSNVPATAIYAPPRR